MVAVKEIELNQLPALRRSSAAMSAHLEKRLRRYVETVSPLFAPRKVIGEFMQSSQTDRVPGADRNFVEIEETYGRLVKACFNHAPKLRAPVPAIRGQLDLQPWEYAHVLPNGQTVWITAPNRWVLTYRASLTVAEILHADSALSQEGGGEAGDFLLRALVMAKLFDVQPAIGELFADLRFSVETETADHRGGLTFTVLTAAAPTFRPQDDVIETVVDMSGKLAFEELIDLDGVRALQDPLVNALTAAASNA